MARIKISPIYPVGFDFFQDDENFLNDLTNEEIANVFAAGVEGILTNAVVYTFVIETAMVKQVESPAIKSPVVQSRNTVSVGVGLETYSVMTTIK